MGRGSAGVRLKGMGRSSVGAKLRDMGKDSIGASLKGMGSSVYLIDAQTILSKSRSSLFWVAIMVIRKNGC